MSDLQVIQQALQRAARRGRWLRAWRGLWQGFLIGAVLWLVFLGCYKVLPLPAPTLAVAGAAALAMVPLGLLWSGRRAVTLAEAARWVDLHENFQERLSTALEVAGRPQAGHWGSLLLADAAVCARKIDPRRLAPVRLPRASHWTLLTLAVALGLGFVPEYRSQELRKKRLDAEVIKYTGERLAELTRHSLEQRKPVLDNTQQRLDAVGQLGEHLAKATVSRADALKDLASLTDKLKQDARQLAQNPAYKRLEQAARGTGGEKNSPANARMQKQLDEIQKALGKNPAAPEALDQLKKELQKAAQAAAGLANKDSAGDSQAKDQMSQSMANLAQQAKEMGLSLPGLEDAIQALQAGQADLLVRDLNAALTDLEKMKEMAQAFQQMQQQGEKLGKDLAEQLEMGQAQAAQGTLEIMILALKGGALNPEDLKRILEQVAKAVGPAKDYGKVADFLKKAVGEMQQGKGGPAAENLAAAAKELERLLAEAGDLESLKASLEAMQKASFCIGTGQSWMSGLRPGQRPGSGRGKPGKGGFGTWVDEEGWLEYPEISDLWENPPDDRGALDPRSALDRGEGQLADNLDPTKLRGQLQPGRSMPGISLKGVSIKGTSTVEFKEASMAAQSEAQNALSQDQIPRAYQGAVKGYFDDFNNLKK